MDNNTTGVPINNEDVVLSLGSRHTEAAKHSSRPTHAAPLNVVLNNSTTLTEVVLTSTVVVNKEDGVLQNTDERMNIDFERPSRSRKRRMSSSVDMPTD